MDNSSVVVAIILSALSVIVAAGSALVQRGRTATQAQEIVNKTYPGLLETQAVMQRELDTLRDKQGQSDRERAEERGKSNEQIKQLQNNQTTLTGRVQELENLVAKTTFERDEARRQAKAATQEMERRELAHQETMAKTIERMQASFDKMMEGMKAERDRWQTIADQKDKQLAEIADELKREREKANPPRASTAPLTATAALRAISTPDTASLGKLQVGFAKRGTPVHLQALSSSPVVRTLSANEYVQARPKSLLNDEQKWIVITEPTNGWVAEGDLELLPAEEVANDAPPPPTPELRPPFVETSQPSAVQTSQELPTLPSSGNPNSGLQWPTKKPDTDPKPPSGNMEGVPR